MEGWRYAPIPGDDEHQGDEPQNARDDTPRAARTARAISVQLNPAKSGLSRSLADTPTGRLGAVGSQGRH
jgi:hypothetical protein